MSCLLSCSLCIIKNVSNANFNEHSNSQTQHNSLQTNTNSVNPPLKTLKMKPRRPSVIEIERAIGAGRFRDIDPRELEKEKDVRFDMHTMSFPNKFEAPLQKRLRETGEWVTERTEKKFRLSGKTILKVTFFWILPIWAMSILVAAGIIELPFINHFIDQAVM